MTGSQAPYLLVASLQKADPMCALFFGHLAGRAALHIIQYGRDHIAGPLSGASALVIIRGLFEFGNLAACARRLGIPTYYFLDDNFMLIREEVGTYGRLCERYTHDAVRDALSKYAGVLLASEALVAYFREQQLHQHLILYPPVQGPAVSPPPAGSRPFTIAFFGGGHRRLSFIQHVYPAVCRLAAAQPVRLVAVGVDCTALPACEGVEVVTPAYDAAYDQAIASVARRGIDVLVHPSNETANNIFKNPHVLINARAIGAVPVFTNTAPYDAVAGAGIAALCGNTADEWFGALNRLAQAPPLRAAMLSALATYCDVRFGGAHNLDVLDAILQAHPQPAEPARLRRRLTGAACLGYGHLRSRLNRRWQRQVN